MSKTLALRSVDSVHTAVTLINRYSSGHANAIATETYAESSRFTQLATSAIIYINTSPRFVRNPAQTYPIALGITAQRGCWSGFVGLRAFVTTQHILQGLKQIGTAASHSAKKKSACKERYLCLTKLIWLVGFT